jgi:hypothetical protein
MHKRDWQSVVEYLAYGTGNVTQFFLFGKLVDYERDNQVPIYQSIFLWFAFDITFLGIAITVRAIYHTSLEDRMELSDLTSVDEKGVVWMKPDNVYLNVARPFVDVLLRFVAQSLLVWYYVSGIMPSILVLDNRVMANVMRIVTIPFIQMQMRKGMGNVFFDELVVWRELLRSHRFKIKKTGDIKELSQMILRLRQLMSFVSNEVYYVYLVTTLLHLISTSEDPLDFVKDVFAVAFITTLDDESADASEIAVRMRRRSTHTRTGLTTGTTRADMQDAVLAKDKVVDNDVPADL